MSGEGEDLGCVPVAALVIPLLCSVEIFADNSENFDKIVKLCDPIFYDDVFSEGKIQSLKSPRITKYFEMTIYAPGILISLKIALLTN